MTLTRRGAAGALVAFGAAACARPLDAPLSAFDGLVEDWTRELLRDDPELAGRAGVGADLAGVDAATRLTDRSANAVELRRGAALRRLAQLRAIEPRALTDKQRLTHAVLTEKIEASAAAAAFDYGGFGGFSGVAPYALTAGGAHATLPDFFRTHCRVATLADAEAYVARLRAVAAAVDQEAARARDDAARGAAPPDFLVDAAIASLDAASSAPPSDAAYAQGLRAKLATFIPAAVEGAAVSADQRRADALIREADAIVADAIYPAQRRAADLLRQVRARAGSDAGVWRLPDGEGFYRAALRIETTTQDAPETIHAAGRERVRALAAELDSTLRQFGLTDGPIGPRLAAVTADPRWLYPDSDEGRAQLIRDVEARIAAVMAQARDWFATLPRARLEVRRVPAAQEAYRPGAYYEPPSLDGATPGIYFINLRNLAEMTKIDLPTQDYHEAAPGHHFQIALAQEILDAPLLRKLISFSAYVEGWALYAEQFADEMGLHDDNRIGRLGYLRWRMWRAARLVVDTGLHHLRWTRQRAIAYLTEMTGDAPGVIVTEVDRYAANPGQACSYEIGRGVIADLREDARNALGSAFDVRGFHDVCLRNGETPLGALGDQVRAWIEQRRG